jgi:predicted amidophosphoribosyltransferase
MPTQSKQTILDGFIGRKIARQTVMKASKNWIHQISRVTSLVIPAPFTCPGCLFPSWEGICQSCIQSIRRNPKILDATSSEFEGFCPILYSFQNAHPLLKYWKDHPGSLTERHLFQLQPALKEALLKIDFGWIIPIPQSFRRSWRRGHESARTVATFFSNELKVPVIDLLNLKSEVTPRQASLTQWQRELAPNPFVVSSEELGRVHWKMTEQKILLVDDLITSGNTMVRAAEELKLHLPQIKIWAGSLGYRPKRLQKYH